MKALGDHHNTDALRPDQRSSIPATRINWNGVPFEPMLPPVINSRPVRVRRVAVPTNESHYACRGTEDLVLIREFHITMVSSDVTLLLITNAPEAAYELPDAISTPYRDIGTFRDATLTWRGRQEQAFVSASITDPRLSSAPDTSSDPVAAQIVALASVARNSLRSGLIVGGTDFTRGWDPDDIEFANLLMTYKSPAAAEVFSLAEIGRILGYSDETIRRRKLSLEHKHPRLKPIIAAFRTRNAKGQALAPAVATVDSGDCEASQEDE